MGHFELDLCGLKERRLVSHFFSPSEAPRLRFTSLEPFNRLWRPPWGSGACP